VLARITIDDVRPRTGTGAFPAKAAVGERVPVAASIFRDGHDPLTAWLRWRPVGAGDDTWAFEPLHPLGNDEWAGHFAPSQVGLHELVVGAAVDRAAVRAREVNPTGWQEPALRPAPEADQLDRSEAPPTTVWVDRPLGRMSAWYELFPRSEGGLIGAIGRLDAIAAMGFDIVYLPPIHPIGTTHRKGPGNTLVAGPGDPGSPWAIGSEVGGHTAVDPSLGTLDDLDAFVAAARERGLAVALDYALQCSPDHPWITEHPEWFHHRPDGTLRYAENPPKKYQDIYPLAFWPRTADGRDDEVARRALWEACLEIFEHWIAHGIQVFRVDNPHTKPVAFWAWVIERLRRDHPDVVLLAEAFTNPKPMHKLGEIGFTQSYSYFTWRHTRDELREYLQELAAASSADEMRPNFWPNTPDILAGVLRNGGAAAFRLRAVLAATLVPNWGIYSGYELCENAPASEDDTEYAESEKYQLRTRDWGRSDSLAPFIGRLNAIRKAHPAFAELRTIRFHDTDDDQLLAFTKTAADGSDPMLVVVNLDPEHAHAGTLHVDFTTLGFTADEGVVARDVLCDATYAWPNHGAWVRLDPAEHVAHVVALSEGGR
jgi:starch synthase (maltosyl-transferring)